MKRKNARVVIRHLNVNRGILRNANVMALY